MRRPGERALAGKLTVRVGQRKVVLAKSAGESERHILLKALLYALFIEQYPDLQIERNLGLRYKPDLVALGSTHSPRFWAESGVTSRQKVGWLVRHLRDGHLVFAHQAGASDTFAEMIASAIRREPRNGLIEVFSFGDDAWDAIGRDGTIDPATLRPVVRRFDASSRSSDGR